MSRLLISLVVVGGCVVGQARPVYVFTGALGQDEFGTVVDGMADATGDGIPDIVASAPTPSTFWGGGPNTTPGYVRVYSGADGSLIHAFFGDDASDRLGESICGGGDVDGDLHDDIVVGVAQDSTTFFQAGAVRVYSGATGALLWQVFGEQQGGKLGCGVAGGQDLNGDGTPDFVSRWFNHIRAYSGADGGALMTHSVVAFGISGCPVASLGDVNGDGLAEFLVGEIDDFNANGAVHVLSVGSAQRFGLGVGGANTLSLEWHPGLAVSAAGTIVASGAEASGTGAMAFSLELSAVPVAGFVLLVDLDPAHFLTASPLSYDAAGQVSIPFDLRLPGLEGTRFVAQAVELSQSAPQGVFASNGLDFFLTR